jgi:hypothetical protein
MSVSAEMSALSSAPSAFERLEQFLSAPRSPAQPGESFEEFERERHRYCVAAECEALGAVLARWDVNVPVLEIDGERYRQVLRSETEYRCAAGPVRVERSLYGRDRVGEAAFCPLQLRAGIVQGYWSPRAARQALRTVAQMPAAEAAQQFAELGNRPPSRSSLERLPKAIKARWAAQREHVEGQLRAQWTVPAGAVSVAVSLAGVRVPMREGAREAKRAQSRVAGKQPRGPAGYQEVGCGTLSFFDAAGERLATLRLARMPQAKKATLKAMLTAEWAAAQQQCPCLQLVKLADGTRDNWRYLSNALPEGIEVVDFYHAAEHLKVAFAQLHGPASPAATAQFEKYRHLLRHAEDGVEKVIRTLAYHSQQHPRRPKLRTELQYFRRQRHRLRYAQVAAQKLPIGSGVVEAACKTLAAQRMKGSGMRWRQPGGQAILTWRALIQSERFAAGWALVAQTYKKDVTLPNKVVAFPARVRSVKRLAV